MFDIFYHGPDPRLALQETSAASIEEACSRSRTRFFWWVHYLAELDQWDWLWEPPPWQAHQRHAWPDQHQPDSGVYLVPRQGFSDTNHHQDRIIHRLADQQHWNVPAWIDPASIDPRWSPDPASPPYVYEFAVEWAWQNVGGPEYRVPGAGEKKFVCDFVANTLDNGCMQIKDHIALHDPVRRWQPDPTDPPYIYVFGNQWWPAEKRTSAIYVTPGATHTKYIHTVVAQRLPQDAAFVKFYTCEFDTSWEPDPGDPPYIYVFGNQWHSAEVMPTVECRVPGAVEKKYMDEPKAVLPCQDQWWHAVTERAFEFDRSWCPDPGDPPYIYVFGNQWHSAEVMPTVEYHVPGGTERKFMEHPKAKLLANLDAWHVPEEVASHCVDFSWLPDPGDPPYIYHFGTDYQNSVGLTFTVPGAKELKFAGDIPKIDQQHSAVQVLDIFFLDHTNTASPTRFQRLQERYPHAQKVRYANSIMDTIKRCLGRTRHNRFWIVSSCAVYDDFDFAWHSEPWQSHMTHVFGSQWNQWSDTFLINRWEFERHSRWAKKLEQFPNLNFVKDQHVTVPADVTPIYVVDHGNEYDLADLESRYRVVRRSRYFDNYLDTFKRVLKDVQEEYVWIASSICDYHGFDFSWQPEAWQRDMLHVFPTGNQKFGDTFYVPVRAMLQQIQDLKLLDWFDTVNFCQDQRARRKPMPVVINDQDSQVDTVLTAQFAGPLALFTPAPLDQAGLPVVSLWREETKTIVALDRAAQRCIVPRSAIAHIRTQLYDYRYINRDHRERFVCDPLDIVFISNGETNAEMHWQHLVSSLELRHAANQVKRVDGVHGRLAAYQAAALTSDTAWFFAVFAKLKVSQDFDWAWQPDHMQQPKHYIFHAVNPVNGLMYGHQAMIAYNRHLVMQNLGSGLDFTLDQLHEVVPEISGTAYYADTAYSAWRTAFREALKLQYSLPDVENQYRLQQWLTATEGANGDWSVRGATDAVQYYQKVQGDFAALKHSYEWTWLASYAQQIHPELFTQSST